MRSIKVSEHQSIKAGRLSAMLFAVLLLALSSLLYCSSLFAADVTGIPLNQAFETSYSTANPSGYSWDLSGVIAATGDSNVMLGNGNCKNHKLYIVASGTVSIVATFEDGYGSNMTSSSTGASQLTMTAAGTYSLTFEGPVPKFMVHYAITTGQIDDTVVFCGVAR